MGLQPPEGSEGRFFGEVKTLLDAESTSLAAIRLSGLPNAIQVDLEVGRNSLPELLNAPQSQTLSEKAAKQERSSQSNRKSELPVSFRSTKRIVVKRLTCRNFELR
jgi:hypothetical protein